MFKLIVSIVPHNSGELVTNVARQAGANGGTIFMGRGTAQNNIIQLLGLGDTSKDIVFVLVEDKDLKNVVCKIVEECSKKKSHFGVLFTLDVSAFFKSGNGGVNENFNNGDDSMTNSYQMINIIVNKGYAEDAMAAARKAGASGGTVISARGTAREGDAKFFGVEIVPEKEMLMILVPDEKKDDIINAVSSLDCFKKAGSGIVFSNAAADFTLLGKN
ncbi:MAG: transcriptional regulator [Treponema sp.]|nr:transcriptional regulator [Treponema sp.]